MRILSGALLAAGLASGAAAQQAQTDLGRIEYMANCAQCHGVEGNGDGVIAGYLTTPPPDLTVIQRDNDGVFPFADLFAIIQGGATTGPHGNREMPAWGDRYGTEALQVLGWRLDPETQSAYAESRILALIAYLSRIQQP